MFELRYPQSLRSGNQESSMALTGRCRLRGRGIPMETEFGRIMSSRSDRFDAGDDCNVCLGSIPCKDPLCWLRSSSVLMLWHWHWVLSAANTESMWQVSSLLIIIIIIIIIMIILITWYHQVWSRCVSCGDWTADADSSNASNRAGPKEQLMLLRHANEKPRDYSSNSNNVK